MSTEGRNVVRLDVAQMDDAELEQAIDDLVILAVNRRLKVGEAARFGRMLHEWSERLRAA
jgi:hypothetical protein